MILNVRNDAARMGGFFADRTSPAKWGGLLAMVLFCIMPLTARAAEQAYDVVVFGATSGGVTAAVEAARMGKHVVLLEPGKHVGGMTSSGLGWMDVRGTNNIGGLAMEFHKRVAAHYIAEHVDLKKFGNSEWTVEPHVAEAVFNQMLQEAHVPVTFDYLLTTVKKDGPRIVSISDQQGREIPGKEFIDASYEGDLMAKAKVSYVVARESRQQYGEPLAGIMPQSATSALKIDPYVKPGDASSGVIPLVQTEPVGTTGDSSPAIQDYNYRLCMTQDKQNMLPIDPPPDYKPQTYELVARFIAAQQAKGHKMVIDGEGKMRSTADFLKLTRIPHGKTDTNNAHWVSTDYAGYSADYPEADYAGRARIAKAHENYMRGLIHFLATDARVPADIRREVQTWGLAKDEFKDNGGWPFQIYVREARRMVGAYVMTQHDSDRQTHFDDSVGLASYSLDSHICRRLINKGVVIEEGGFYHPLPTAYPISYHALTPKQSDCENLLVPACCSASHVAYASIRMEPVFMILGQSCGTAAAQAIDENTSVQKIDVKKLQTRLIADKQVLAPPPSKGGAKAAKKK